MLPTGKSRESDNLRSEIVHTINPAPATNEDMSIVAKSIIQQQWGQRHNPDPGTRKRARSLIKTHLILLRKWSGEEEGDSPVRH